MEVFTVYDLKTQAHASPFFQVTVGQAVRSFTDTVNSGESQLSRHPHDFILFHVGTFDEAKGTFENLPIHTHLGLAADFILGAANAPSIEPLKEVTG